MFGVKRVAGMSRGCPDLQDRVGGVSGFGRKIFRWPEFRAAPAKVRWPDFVERER